MKKKLIISLLTISMMAGGCGVSNNAAESTTNNQDNSVTDSNSSDEAKETGETEETTDADSVTQPSGKENLPPLNIIDDNYRTTYEIFVYSFADSNADGIGDLKGITQKLDYICDGDDATDSDLGCNQIWVTPIMPSTTYHKYDVMDYKDIDPEFGTMADFEELIKESHARGIRVILDMVLNHSSSQHPWFKEATAYLKNHPELTAIYEENGTDDAKGLVPIEALEKECPYLYYYNFTQEQKTGYEKVNGTNWYYEARFWSEMPDLNLDCEKVREEISDITAFWIDKGVDGFRLDATTY